MRLHAHCSEFRPGVVTTFSTELKVPSPLLIGHDILASLPAALGLHAFDHLFIYIDQGIMQHHGAELHAVCVAAFGDKVRLDVLPQGEACKTFWMLEALLEQLIAAGASKRSVVLAMGGGAACNLVGLAAGMLYRGIRYIEVPTTMTGQTDSCLSNKQAINSRQGKNHFGIYHAPLMIWVDTKYLLSEPARLKRSGLVEGIKNGFIFNPTFLDYLAGKLKPELTYSAGELHELVLNIIRSKLEILKADPSEREFGIVLEYGHTFGHGIEWLAKKHGVSLIHGEAVSFGMCIAARLSRRLGLISDDTVALHHHMITEKLGVTTEFPASVTTDGLIDAMVSDNKKTGKQIRFVLLEKVGACFNPEGDYLIGVDLNIVRSVLDDYIASERSRACA